MTSIKEMIRLANAQGYINDNAEAKVCQDVILKAIAKSPLSNNVTIKGGVVMRSISQNARRATQDIDIDFIRYSLSDDSIRQFIKKLDCLEDIHIHQTGEIYELNQQDYNGKRIYVLISDEFDDSIESKVDLGVHKNLDIAQEEYCFDIACYDGSATLLINSKEQMFTEKLRSLLKFGPYSTRYKDVFDMYYLAPTIDTAKLAQCLDTFIINDPGMKENNMNSIIRRITNTFSSNNYITKLTASNKNWINEEIPTVTSTLIEFLRSLASK
ncbi:MAG: nucleotidyl transferase AbiEii/AbiGii toxin family protein [Lachnospiraceae bacterium]|nr:nucleotidyl transferase AbiEii/AbiGii toxin family protein [Lachnospiraceae bacterium]